MKRIALLIALTAALALAALTSSAHAVVCNQACWNWLGGDDYSIEWTENPIVFSGDNASSVCLDHGGVKSVSYKPGQGWQGEAVIIAVVECMDGTTHEIDTSRKLQGGAQDGGDGNPNHTFEENNTPPTDPGTEYTQCPGTDDPAYDPNNEACW